MEIVVMATKTDESKTAKEKLAWCAVSCAAACRSAQNARIHLAATSDPVRNPVNGSAAADIPDFIAVDLCARSTVGRTQRPTSDG